MVGESVQAALENLKKERTKLDGAIAALEGLVGIVTVTAAPAKRRGRPPNSALKVAPALKSDAAPAKRGKRQNAPKGLLRKMMIEVLKGAKKPLAPVEVRNLLLKAGYPSKNPKTLYTTIFSTAKKDPEIKKTPEGFSLKESK
jgi:hypothetical protein